MTKSEMSLHDLAYLGPGLLFLDQYFNSIIDEYLVLWVALVSLHLNRFIHVHVPSQLKPK